MTILVTILAKTSFSQASLYKPFCINPSWTTENVGLAGYSYFTYDYQKDTIVNLKTYKKIIDISNPSSFCLLRENIALKQVYIYDFPSATELVHADFSLNVGSTFIYSMSTGTVTLKDSVLISGQYCNHLSLSLPGLGSIEWTEGILSSRGPLSYYSNPVLCVTTTLKCFCQTGISYYNNGTPCFLSCSTAGISENKIENKDFSVYPNPTTGILFLESHNYSFEKENMEIKITNIVGEEIKKISFRENSQELNLNGLSNGVYFLNVLKEGKTLFTKKFIKE